MFTSDWVENNAEDYDELISAINRGDETSVSTILSKCSMSGWEANPLYFAVSSKNDRIKQMMCDHYRKFDRYSMIVLMNIVKDWNTYDARDKKIYETIIYELTANNDSMTKNSANGTMLAQACESGNIDIVRVLIKQGTNLNVVGKNCKYVPLHLAIMRKQPIVVDELMRAGANVNISDKDGNRALHFAAESGNVSVVKALLRHGASLDCKNYTSKCTPLYTAVERGHVAVVEELIKVGANLQMLGKDGKSTLHVASEMGHVEIVELLLANGVDVDCRITGSEYTPLFLAVEKGHSRVVECLLRAKADANAFAANGKTPLYVAVEFDRTDVVNVLLECGADLHIGEQERKSSLLHLAASYEDKFVIEKLVAMGIDIDTRDTSGKTPLHVAACRGKLAVKSLLSLGADKSLEDFNGRLAFHDAIENRNFDAINILFDVNAARFGKIFHKLIGDVLKDCECPSYCEVKPNDAVDRLLMRLSSFEAVNVKVCDDDKLKLHKIRGKSYYDECLAEAQMLKDFSLISEGVSLYDFLHMRPKRRLAHVERVPSDLAGYRIYGSLIEDNANEATERKSLFEMTRKALYDLTSVFLPDICVDCISDFLSVECLRNLSKV